MFFNKLFKRWSEIAGFSSEYLVSQKLLGTYGRNRSELKKLKKEVKREVTVESMFSSVASSALIIGDLNKKHATKKPVVSFVINPPDPEIGGYFHLGVCIRDVDNKRIPILVVVFINLFTYISLLNYFIQSIIIAQPRWRTLHNTKIVLWNVLKTS